MTQFEFAVNVRHIPGVDNSIADWISRFQMEKCFRMVPEADKVLMPIPAKAWHF